MARQVRRYRNFYFVFIFGLDELFIFWQILVQLCLGINFTTCRLVSAETNNPAAVSINLEQL